MGHSHIHGDHYEAVDGLVNLFAKANHDLTMVQHKLQKEFQHIYPDNANPMNLVSRIKKVHEDLSSLKEQWRELLAAKQGMIRTSQALNNQLFFSAIVQERLPMDTMVLG
ncbi:uncharacterized protein LOC130756618 isoform X2 [Actinidia eriantha]|uniref:uncharacterized protein LOC130756618 isoform X2 n=1 Tax=Actinidia eriantha TaxID=165200 RepID=UPI0025853205|nr:uncharacterized protein LOC130756618 isoform X2 [Actinidia eriantha]XP_057467155.1 uncharacterized protein LOC130756618 isoform X2 [Actinidia eriantha]